MEAAIVIAAYVMFGAASVRLFRPWCKENGTTRDDYDIFSTMSFFFWPVFVIASMGIGLSKVKNIRLPDRDAKRREREIAEANHKLALAQIEAKAIAASETNAGLR